MDNEKIKPLVISITIILSLWLLAFLIFVLGPSGIGMLMIIPLGLLSIAIIRRNRIAWWIGAIVFGLAGVFNVLWLIAVDLNSLHDMISGNSKLQITAVGIFATLFRIITVVSAILYFRSGARRYCLGKAK